MFTKANNPGQVVYLSSGFVEQNINLIKSKGYGVNAYSKGNGESNEVVAPYNKIDDVDKVAGYNWFRPLNTIVSVQDQQSLEIKFIRNLISSERSNELKKLGAQSLSNSEKSEFGYNNPS
jgi:ABC-type phosphate transport system substrate-binding protein